MPLEGVCPLGGLGVLSLESWAIEVSPTKAQIDRAVEQGLETVQARVLPK